MTTAYGRVLVTGGNGFLGRWVVDELRQRGHHDINAPSSAEYDLTRQDAAEAMFNSFPPDVVIHLAGEVGGVGANRDNPGRFFYANAAMGLNVIELSQVHEVRRLIYVGTVSSYPENTPIPFQEEDLWSGYPEATNASYGIAKRALLTMLNGYGQQYGLQSTYLLLTNLYGPGDNFDLDTGHVVPSLIARFANAVRAGRGTVSVWGDGNATRDLLYVRDAANAIVSAIECAHPGPINVGTGDETSISELANLIAQATGFGGRIEWDTSKPQGPSRRALSVTRAKEHLGFEATTRLASGLAQTVDWWKRQS